MSYRLITKAVLASNLSGDPVAIEIRAYAEPKAAPIGTLQLDGEAVPFKLTGGKGRGLLVRTYVYFPCRGESAYAEITGAMAEHLRAGNPVSISTGVQPAAPAIETVAPAKAKRRAKVAVTEDALV